MYKSFLFLLLVPFSAFSVTETEWGGRFWGNELRKSNEFFDTETEQNAGGFFFGKTKPTENTTVKAELIGYYVKTPVLVAPKKNLKGGDTFGEVNELSLTYSTDSFNVKAGQMTTSWGKSDGLNPTDFLSGRRNVLLVPEDQLTRRGHGSAMIEWLPDGGSSPWSFQQWVVPFHSVSDVLLSQNLTGNIVELDSNQRSGRVEIATKINYSGQGWEFDYTYFNGVTKSPVYTASSVSLLPLHIKLQPNYVHQESHGINLTKDFEDYVIRFEGAYSKRNEVLATDYITDPSRLDAVAGFERSFFESHRLNVQGVVQHYPNYHVNTSSDLFTNQIQLFNRFTFGQHLPTRVGYLLVYYFEPSSYNQLKFKASWLNYFHRESASFFTPQIDYLVTENFQLQTYAMVFSGSKSSPFGILGPLSSIAFGGTYHW